MKELNNNYDFRVLLTANQKADQLKMKKHYIKLNGFYAWAGGGGSVFSFIKVTN